MFRTVVLVAVAANVLFIATSEATEDCNEDRCPGANQIYVECPDCSPQTCDSIGKKYNCPLMTTDNCKPACRCKEGFYRNDDNECIPEDECPNQGCNEDQCTGDNEIYDECPDCSPQTCDSIGKIYHCPLMTTANCKPACRCKSDYFRNADNECIPKDQCPPQCGENEVYDMCVNGGCDKRNCSQINDPRICIDPLECEGGCACTDGYLRNDNGKCVPQDECQKANQCKCNEVYDECPNLCEPQTCDLYGTVIFCPAQKVNGTCVGQPACICKDGYLRNENGDCIPKEDCTSCGRDPNAVPGCGINCNRHCSDINKEPTACITLCRTNACDCKEGYYLDGNTNKCVKHENCTPPCGENEVYDMCVNGGCNKRNCSQINDPRICIDPLECEGGCVCTDGYLRNDNGKCVPQDECQKESCHDDPNTVPGCSNYCGKSCTDYNTKPKPCPLFCLVDGCDCKKGYVYDSSIKRCVLPKDCPKKPGCGT